VHAHRHLRITDKGMSVLPTLVQMYHLWFGIYTILRRYKYDMEV